MKRFLPLLVVLVIAAAAAWFWLNRRGGESTGFFSGYAEGELVYVASPIAGQLETLTVNRGDQIEKAALLFELERKAERAARAEAEETSRESDARLDKANLDFTRAKSLREKRVISPEDYDTAQQNQLAAEHASAARKNALEQADWRFSQKVQSAPVSGLVYDTYFRPGEWVPAGTPVLSILPPEYMKVRFFVPEGALGKFQIGTPLEIISDGLRAPLAGKVSFVSPQAEYTLPIIYSRENRGKLVFLVEASLTPDEARQLHADAPVEVHLKSASDPSRVAEQGK